MTVPVPVQPIGKPSAPRPTYSTFGLRQERITSLTIIFEDQPRRGIVLLDEIGRLMTRRTLLIVEDDDLIRGMIADIATDFGYAVTSVGSCELALDHLSKTSVDVLLSDQSLGSGMNGVELISQRLIRLPGVVILMSGDPLPKRVPIGTRYLSKPFTIKALEDALQP